jgi:hypothetical protein
MEKQLGVMMHSCHPSYGRKCKTEELLAWAKKQDPISTTTKTRRAGCVTQEVVQSPQYKPQYCQKKKKKPKPHNMCNNRAAAMALEVEHI